MATITVESAVVICLDMHASFSCLGSPRIYAELLSTFRKAEIVGHDQAGIIQGLEDRHYSADHKHAKRSTFAYKLSREQPLQAGYLLTSACMISNTSISAKQWLHHVLGCCSLNQEQLPVSSRHSC